MSVRAVVLSLIVVVVAVWLVAPTLLGTDKGTPDIKVLNNEDPDIARVLNLKSHSSALGEDLLAYSNHCHRVLNYAYHFDPEAVGDEGSRARAVVATALAYHDIGLWTDARLDYVLCSNERFLRDYTSGDGGEFASIIVDPPLTDAEIHTIEDIIVRHHKVTAFGEDGSAAAEAVRKADWCDATTGIVHYGISSANQAAVNERFPNAGFTDILAMFAHRLHGFQIHRWFDLLQIYYW
eukprot:TRINITY_DN9078_c0_g1_i1.p1 TRINITY_DN9078_c0_g1~~TRINITY_DN9078_c0_g1_i1.p1  ORF type:complete len:237 (-),score=31.39 TRINITY_DN9078_c0_g1_i1:113-823(-)